MVGAAAASDAVARAKRLPELRVGLHVVLVEGRPILPPERIPDLVDANGWFRNNMLKAGIDFFFRPGRRRQLVAEIEAQFRAYHATGLALDHVNTHKHFHLHPTIAGAIVRIGRRYGLGAMRVPFEPARLLRDLEPGSGRRAAQLVAPWAALLRQRLRRQGFVVPDRVFGLAWSGAMTTRRLTALLSHLPAGTTEIYLHPATTNVFEGSAPGYRYAEELAALTAPAVKAATEASGARLCGFAELAKE
jgi:hopanoid biosynthesis associated protein HpnK